jgi:hypothetical protein
VSLAGGSGVIGNPKKTEYFYFAVARPPEVPSGGLVFKREQIRRVEGTRFLGGWVDAELNWRGHIDQVAGKMRQLLGVGPG